MSDEKKYKNARSMLRNALREFEDVVWCDGRNFGVGGERKKVLDEVLSLLDSIVDNPMVFRDYVFDCNIQGFDKITGKKYDELCEKADRIANCRESVIYLKGYIKSRLSVGGVE